MRPFRCLAYIALFHCLAIGLHADGTTIAFTPNRGQIVDMAGKPRPDILFTAESNGLRIYFRRTGISYLFIDVEDSTGHDLSVTSSLPLRKRRALGGAVSMYRMDVELEGSNPRARTSMQEQTAGYSNYYLAQCPEGITHVPSFGTITYHDIYPHIDLIFYSGNVGMKYDFIVRPGGRVSDIRMRYNGADGLSLRNDGGVRVVTPLGEIAEGRPETFQPEGGTTVPSRFLLDGDLLRFDVGAYDSTRLLTIDPTLVWSTYFGGAGGEITTTYLGYIHASTIAMDTSRNLLTTGSAYGTGFPSTTGAFQVALDSLADACLIKLSSSGARLWATYYGGSHSDYGTGVAVDSSNNVFITGYTSNIADWSPGSNDFLVTTGAFQTSSQGSVDCYIVKFDSTGARLWGSYYGGSVEEYACGVAADTAGNVVFTAETASGGLASTGAYRTMKAGNLDMIVVKFSGNGTRLWATYCGGTNTTSMLANAVCIDRSANVLVAGETSYASFPTSTNAFQTTKDNNFDAFVVKLTSGGAMLWSTFLGGNNQDHGGSIAVDRDSNIYVGGFTSSTDFPVTTGAYQSAHGGGTYDAFIASFTSSGAFRWATYYGGAGNDGFSALAADRSGNVTVTGQTFSANFPVTADAYQSTRRANDAVIVRFDSAGTRLWATYFGGDGQDWGAGLVVDHSGLVVAGTTTGPNFPTTTGAFQTTRGGDYDIFISRFCAITPRISLRGRDICAGDSVVLTAPIGFEYYWSTGATSRSIVVRTSGGYWVRANEGSCIGYSDTVTVTVHALPTPVVSVIGSLRFCQGDSVVLDAGAFRSWRWSTGDTTRRITVRQAGSYSVTVDDQWRCSGISPAVVVVVDSLPVARIAAANRMICPGDSVALEGPPGYARYLWNTGDTTRRIYAASAGSYWLRITNANNCSSPADTVTLGMHQRPAPVISPALPRYCISDSTTLSAPEGYLEYRWSNGATTRQIRVGDSLVYTVTVTDSNGCRGTSPVVKATPWKSPVVTITPTGPISLCPGDSLRISAVPGLASYQWSTGATTAAITVRSPGVYSVIGTDANGCRDSARFAFNNFPQPAPAIVVQGAWQQSSGVWGICEGDTAILSAPGFQDYQWSTGETSQTIPAARAGRYSLHVTAVTGCRGNSDTVEMVVLKRPRAAFTGASALCVGSSGIYSATAQPGVRYIWTVTGGSVVSGEGTSELTVRWPAAGGGSVRLVAVDPITGCSSRDSIIVDVGTALTPTVRPSRSPLLCVGDTVTLDAGAGYRSYLWSTGATTRTITVDHPGDYTVMVEDSSGCSGRSLEVRVRIQPPPTPRITSIGSMSFCEGDSVELDAGTGYSEYQWSSGQRTPRIVVRAAGSYSVTVTDSAGCIATSAAVDVRPAARPTPVISGPNSVCENATKTYSVVAVAGDSYLWTVSPGGSITGGQGTPAVTVRWGTSAIEQVAIQQTNGAGCSSDVTTYSVEVGTSLHPAVTPSGDIWLCDGQTIELVAADGYDSYLWSTGERTRSIVVRSAGSYRVAVSEGGGCSGESDPVTVRMSPLPTPVILPGGPVTLCEGDSTRLDAGEWKSYQWSTGERTRTIVVRTADDYSVTVEDANGCRGRSQDVTVTIARPPAVPTISQRGDTLLSSPALTYQWLRDDVEIPGENRSTYVVLQPGRYRVRITDANGCSSTSEPVVPDAEAASATVVIRNYEAAPGQRISIPIDLDTPLRLERNGFHTFRARIRFNRSMLSPTGGEVASAVDGDHLIVTLTGRVDPLDGDPTLRLGSIELIAALGNAVETPLEILSLEFGEGPIRLDTIHGRFRLVGLCENGGTRLVDASGRMSLKPSRPNPTGGLTVIEYEVIELGPTRLYLTDMSGRTIPLVDAFLEPGHYLASFDASAIGSGTYLCVLQTETLRMTSVMVVEH